MINRIRAIRKEKGLTLAQLAARCDPPTTAQTIGRLETGMRNLSIKWMDRIGAGLGVDPQTLVRGEASVHPQAVARLCEDGPDALAHPRDAVLPTDLGSEGDLLAVLVEASVGEYRAGDQLWMRRIDLDGSGRAINRDVLVPRKGGRFAFGRLIDRQGNRVGILPPQLGERQVVVDNPAWLAVAEMLVRKL